MTSMKGCIFNRNAKCIFKGGDCDRDCDQPLQETAIHSNESSDDLEKRLGTGKKRFAISSFFPTLFGVIP